MVSFVKHLGCFQDSVNIEIQHICTTTLQRNIHVTYLTL